MNSTQLQQLLQHIDALNAADPQIEHDPASGKELPKELLYGRRMSAMLTRYCPQASLTLQIAARAQHIQRWLIPRQDYPAGSEGYKAWRRRLYDFHAETTARLMAEAGFDLAAIATVKRSIAKRGIKQHEESQQLEDIAALVFLEHYLQDFMAAHPDYTEEKWLALLCKTGRKMSANGRRYACEQLTFPAAHRTLLQSAFNSLATHS